MHNTSGPLQSILKYELIKCLYAACLTWLCGFALAFESASTVF